jgi:hypothetical protein
MDKGFPGSSNTSPVVIVTAWQSLRLKRRFFGKGLPLGLLQMQTTDGLSLVESLFKHNPERQTGTSCVA